MSVNKKSSYYPMTSKSDSKIDAIATFNIIASVVFTPYLMTIGVLIFFATGMYVTVRKSWIFINELYNYKLLFILPAYCVLSTVWSNYPEVTIRYSLQLTLTLFIAVIVAISIKSRIVLTCTFYAQLIAFLLCVAIELISRTGAAWQGFYGSKNGFAVLSTSLMLVSMAIYGEKQMRKGVWVALLYVLISPYFIVKAQSAGAIIALVPVIIAAIFFWSTKFVSTSSRWVVLCGLAIILCAGTAMLFANTDAITGGILVFFDKDETLTGRTELWEFAYRLIAQNPWLGVGYRGFWVIGSQDAEALWAKFMVPSGAGFNFHNTYISNAVDIGYVGVGMQIVILCIAFVRGLKLCMEDPKAGNIYWFSIVAFTVTRSFSEVTVFTEFDFQSMLVYMAYIKIDQSLRMSRQIGLQRVSEKAILNPVRSARD